MVTCLQRDADLHMAQLMPLPLTVFCFNKIQIGFTILVLAHLGSPGQWAVKQVCKCVVLLSQSIWSKHWRNTCTCTAKWPSVKYLARRDTIGFYSMQTVTAVTLRSNSFLRSNNFAKTLLHYLMLSLSSAFTSRMSSAIQWQRHQLSAIAAAHPPAWSVGSCWQKVSSFGACTRAHVVCCKAPLFQQDVQLPWLVQKRFRSHYLISVKKFRNPADTCPIVWSSAL